MIVLDSVVDLNHLVYVYSDSEENKIGSRSGLNFANNYKIEASTFANVIFKTQVLFLTNLKVSRCNYRRNLQLKI